MSLPFTLPAGMSNMAEKVQKSAEATLDMAGSLRSIDAQLTESLVILREILWTLKGVRNG